MTLNPAVSLAAILRATLPFWIVYSLLAGTVIGLLWVYLAPGIALALMMLFGGLIVPLSIVMTHWSFFPYMRRFYQKYRNTAQQSGQQLRNWYDWQVIRMILASSFWHWHQNLTKIWRLPFVHHEMGAAIGFRDRQYGKQTTGHGGVICLFDARKVLAFQLIIGGVLLTGCSLGVLAILAARS